MTLADTSPIVPALAAALAAVAAGVCWLLGRLSR